MITQEIILRTRRDDPLFFDAGSPAEAAYNAAERAAYEAVRQAAPGHEEAAWWETWRRLEPTWRNAPGLHTREELEA